MTIANTNFSMTLIYILITIISTTVITRLVAFLMNRMNKYKKDMTAVYLIRDIINSIIYFISIMIILQFFGINLTGTLLSLGVVGIAVSLASRDILSNLFSGIILIIGRSIKVGDTIEINNKKGFVDRITPRTTTIIDDMGVKNNIPNSTLTNNNYLLYKTPEKYRVDIIAGLNLNVDIEKFKDFIIEKIESHSEISKNPKPTIFACEITFEQSEVKVSFWVKDFNNKDKYKIIITNEIRKYCIGVK